MGRLKEWCVDLAICFRPALPPERAQRRVRRVLGITYPGITPAESIRDKG